MDENILAELDPENYQCPRGSNLRAVIAKLENTGFTGIGRNDRTPIIIKLPFAWNGTDATDRNWMFQLHAWRMLDPYLGLMTQGLKNRNCFDYCAAVISDWIRDNILGEPGDFTWYDMSTGIRASKLALMARAATAFDADLTKVAGFAQMLTQHFKHLINPRELNRGNHGLFQMWGLKSLAAAFPDHPMSDASAAYAVRMMSKLIISQMGDLGVHTENSPDYHFFTCKRIGIILAAPDWQVPEMAAMHDLMVRAEMAKPWLVDPLHHIVPIGDSSRGRIRPNQHSNLTQWPHQSNRTGLGAVLDGYAVVRSRPDLPQADASYLFVTASFHSQVHKHDDCLSLFWQEGGADILIDPGKYAYQKDEFRKYFVGRHAHNTLEFDNKSSGVQSANRPYGSGIRHVVPMRGGAWLVQAEAPCNPKGDVHRRRIFFQPGRYLMVFDQVEPGDEKSHDYRIWWHFPENAQIKVEQDACVVNGLADQRILRMRYASAADKMSPQVHIGEIEPRVQGWYSPGYMKREPAPALGLSASARGVFEAVTFFEWGDGNFSGRDSDYPDDLSSTERSLLGAVR